MQVEELTLVLFTVGNAVRALAYVPQICKAATDRNGASGISYTSWAMFMVAHLSTVAYALVNASDWTLAAWFALNAFCCAAIIGVAEWNRQRRMRSILQRSTAEAA